MWSSSVLVTTLVADTLLPSAVLAVVLSAHRSPSLVRDSSRKFGEYAIGGTPTGRTARPERGRSFRAKGHPTQGRQGPPALRAAHSANFSSPVNARPSSFEYLSGKRRCQASHRASSCRRRPSMNA
jgi:hypothetical protein